MVRSHFDRERSPVVGYVSASDLLVEMKCMEDIEFGFRNCFGCWAM